ncbi:MULTISPECIES: lipopolysaccharide transport periplasmic protein LptA [Janthinobacterium]|jgi:lipopolysaccharide export system protein LptA|uniref:lipopolysaccharide transport periplasmic protein LptA n=1 Tax=Janthinobacterium TaxID=29580 RepID=UPI001C5A7D24|nr:MULTISPECIES: lipopolysaccharide transport periplasmic protein LptA [Janthinobacterium]MBW3510295.1 lipopolysaccharide transport periplasmic protein LptA [Janthinobacterium sp. NKUCC06_STL]MCA1862178.1 lipopolysaccharide transport periplasmic protein LptA [Janthinobacterium lividum]
MKKILLLTVFSLAIMGVAHAEKADSEKEAVITARSGHIDDIKQVRTLTGDVVLVKGTLTMKAGRALITEDPQGYQFITFWADPGKLATFRQKRDGAGDLWVEGEAERVEYNNKTEVVKLFSRAKLTRLEGAKVTDVANGAFISYDSRKEEFAMENSNSGTSTADGGSVRMVIQPKTKAPAAEKAPATPAPGKK